MRGTAAGVKLGLLLGFIFSNLFNASGIGVLLESVVQWTGAFKYVIEIYKQVVVEPFSLFLMQFFEYIGISISPPRLLATYYSLAAGLSFSYVCLSRLRGGPTDSADFYSAAAKLSPFSLVRSAVFSSFRFSRYTYLWILAAAPVYFIITIPFIMVLLTIFPIVFIKQTVYSIILHFRFDFSRAPMNAAEDESIKRAKKIYNSTVTFWFVIFCTLIFLGFVVLINNELIKKCVEDFQKFQLLCERRGFSQK